MILWRKQSIIEIKKNKPNLSDILKQNEALKKANAEQEARLTQTQLALCDVFEAILAGNGGVS